jgi:hypothetical protein
MAAWRIGQQLSLSKRGQLSCGGSQLAWRNIGYQRILTSLQRMANQPGGVAAHSQRLYRLIMANGSWPAAGQS